MLRSVIMGSPAAASWSIREVSIYTTLSNPRTYTLPANAKAGSVTYYCDGLNGWPGGLTFTVTIDGVIAFGPTQVASATSWDVGVPANSSVIVFDFLPAWGTFQGGLNCDAIGASFA